MNTLCKASSIADKLCCSVSRVVVQDRGNAWRASLGKICRKQYLLRYPVRIIRPDGSSIEIRGQEPRQVVQLAVDLNALSKDERLQRLAARKPKVKKIEEEVIDDNFDADDYLKFFTSNSPTSSVPKQEKSKKKVNSK